MNKKLILLASALMTAAVTSAADALLSGSIDFDTPSLWGKLLLSDGKVLDDEGTYRNQGYWYFAGEDYSMPMQKSGTASGYLGISTDVGLYRTVRETPVGTFPESGHTIPSGGLYIDSTIEFSPYLRLEPTEVVRISSEDKLSCWFYISEDEGVTNFVVSAGLVEEDEESHAKTMTPTNYVTALAVDDPYAAHRLTLRATTEDGVPGFNVYIDKVLVTCADGRDFFPSMCTGDYGTSAAVTVTALGFIGSGSADMINFTATNPLEKEDYDKPDLTGLRQSVEIVVTDYPAGRGSLIDFPMPVRISPTRIPGFSYTTTRAFGADLRFTDENGKLLPCDVDTWNDADGESLVWVRVPFFRNGAKITMYWDIKTGGTAPANDYRSVWSDYIAVWHFGDKGGNVSAKDSTGHGYTASMTDGKLRAAPTGVLGTAATASGGDLQTGDYELKYPFAGSFTMTGWYRAESIGESDTTTVLFGKFANGFNTEDTLGWYATAAGKDAAANKVRYHLDGKDKYVEAAGPDNIRSNWFHTAFTYSSGTALAYVDALPGSPSTLELSGNDVVCKVMADGLWADEVRLTLKARSANWVLAEYESMTNLNFCTFGNAATRDDYNFWLEEPSISPTAWARDEASGVVVNPGRARYCVGGTAILYCREDGTKLGYELPTEVGRYKAIFTAVGGAVGTQTKQTLVKEIHFAIYDRQSFKRLPGRDRVMLFNSDVSTGCEIGLQGFWDIDEDDELVWDHTYEPWEGTGEFVSDGAFHRYFEPGTGGPDDGGTCLWQFRHARIGNLFQGDEEAAHGGLSADMNYLPWSSRGCRYLDSEKPADRQRYAGTLILQNISTDTEPDDPAAVYSPYYTNGVGTIYFDAVNAYASYRNTLQLEICPTRAGDDVREGEWTVVPVDVFAVVNGVHSPEETVSNATTIVLAQTAGGSTNSFYRIRAKLDTLAGLRFRIIRTDTEEDRGWGTGGVDGEGLISLDNIIVSTPAMGVKISQYGIPMNTTNTLLRGWWQGAFDVPYPTAGDTVHGRLKVDYIVNGTNAASSSFVAQASMFGRWRYLNQDVGDWKEYALSAASGEPTCFISSETLPFDEVGDFEYYFKVSVNAPYYDYHDYSGLADWTLFSGSECRGDLSLRATDPDQGIYVGESSPALGNDFFIRLRDGSSDVESVAVVLGGVRSEEIAMTLVGDHIWRGLALATNKTGNITFSFRERRNLREPYEYAIATSVWNPKTSAVALPTTAETVEGGEPGVFASDGASNYVEFRYNDDTHEFSIGHAEYQDFNAWHDANLGDEVFVGRYSETSGVNQVAMIETNAHMATWSLLSTTNENWNESFELSNYMDPGYPKDVAQIQHKMPHLWYGYWGMFVDKDVVANSQARTNSSGIAWQMRGESQGSVEYSQKTGPSGLDTVSFQAHLAQSIKFSDFSVWNGDGANGATNYTFVIPAIMSRNYGTDMAPGAAISLVGYYRQHYGCYEFRVERAYTKTLRLSIYKWHEQNYSIEPECLGTQLFDSSYFWAADTSSAPKLYGIYISVGADTNNLNATTIVAGLSNDRVDPTTTSKYSGQKYRAICCVDTNATSGVASPRFTCGAFGVLTKNCPGVFLTPTHYDSVIDSTTSGSTDAKLAEYPAYKKYWNNKVMSFQGTLDSDGKKFVTDWDFPAGRIEKYTTLKYSGGDRVGLRTPTNVAQTVGVYLRSRNDTGAEWNCVTNVTVSSYGFAPYEVELRSTADSDVKLMAGPVTADVTIWNIRQVGWRGEDIAGIDNIPYDFVYTQARVFDSVSVSGVTNRWTMLQPARALAKNPLSIRTPILSGLGMIGFSYRDVQPGCEVWVQMATNSVAANMNVLNQSLDEGAGPGEWTTIRKFTEEELLESNSQSVYLGIHTSEANPVRGVMRILIAPSVVEAAADHENRDYGAITITDIWAHDEPAIDTSSWWGWNIRTAGDASDTEGRMYLPDGRIVNRDGSASYGLSGALNNSLIDGTIGDTTEYAANNPFVQSPTFGEYTTSEGKTSRAGIGVIRFRARLYDRSAVGSTARVAIYGVLDGATKNWGVALTNLEVSTLSFREYEYRATKKRKFAAIRLVIEGVTNEVQTVPAPQRVLFDDIVVSEKPDVALSFEYARPFRTGLGTDAVITDILTREQQPLIGESWGLQAKLRLQKLGNEVDTNRPFRVTFRSYVGSKKWGYANWCDDPLASEEIDLVQMGEKGEYVFRSSLAKPETVLQPQDEPGTIVQYMLTVYYYPIGEGEPLGENIEWSKTEGMGWTNPSWYAPRDLNDEKAGTSGDWSPYTILDSISPGRAWINEVNYNDGPRRQSGNQGVAPTTNQFIEIAIPAGIDLARWKVKVTDMDHNTFTIATLGSDGVASKKMTEHKSGDYDFLVIQSPATRDAGGIHAPDGSLAADGTWTSDTMSGNFKSGTFRYGQPYEISLYRSTGVLEHQFVIQGTNEYRGGSYGYEYEGTNLVAELQDIMPETAHFYAGEDFARWTNDTDLASLGVTGSYHGEEGGWATMKMTAGRINADQDPLVDWFLKPNGTNVWIYAQAYGDHLSQRIGDDTLKDTYVIVPAGGSTNIEYDVKKWYQIDSITINGVTNAESTAAEGHYVLKLTNVVDTMLVVAREGISSKLIDAGLDPNGLYTPAVMRWLEGGQADGRDFASDEIRLGHHKGLGETDPIYQLSLVAHYWLDLDPTMGGWWLRTGISDFAGLPIYRKRTYYEGTAEEYTLYYTNREIQVTMFLSNDVVNAIAPEQLPPNPFAPKRFQGLSNEKSDDFSGSWTSVNFKVTAWLKNNKQENAGYLPFRWFVFGADSFYPADSIDPENPPFTARIEILDPFSPSSPGHSYGWGGYGDVPVWFRFSIDSTVNYSTIEMLKKDSTYNGSLYQLWDGSSH